MAANKDFEIVYWDWKEKTPVLEISKLVPKYKHAYEISIDDGNYMIFSDFIIKDDEEAEKLIWIDCQ